MAANLATFETIAAMQEHGGPQAKALAALWLATVDPSEQAAIQDTWGHVFRTFAQVSPHLDWKRNGQAA